MGKVIKIKIQGMGWWLKTSLVLLLTLATTIFMYEGWYKPRQTQAAVATVTNWAHPSTGTSGPHTITNATFSCGAGSNRLLVAVVTGEVGTAAAANVTATKGTGINFTTAVSTTSARTHVWIGYLTESQINGNTNGISITNNSGQAWTGSDVYLTCYSGVDQGQPLVTSGTWSAASDTAAASSAMSIPVVNGGVIVYGNGNNNGVANSVTETSINPATPAWTEPFDLAGTGYSTMVGEKLVTATTTPVTTTFNWTSQRYANAAISLNPASSTSAPTVTTPTATAITNTTATLGANVTSDGGAALTARGTCWGASASPATNCVAEGGTATGVFTQARTGLTEASLLYYRGYATNSVGTSYSTDGSFWTEPTTQASNVTFTGVGQTSMTINWTRGSGGATGGVLVLMKAGSAISGNPTDGTYTGYTANTAYGSGTLITDGYVVYKGTGTNVTVTGLTASTTYYVEVFEFAGQADTSGVNQGTAYNITAPASGNQMTSSPCAAGTPTTLTVGTETNSSVPLTWTGQGTTNYFNVYRDGIKISADGAVTTGAYTDSTAVAGSAYSYTVSGYNTGGACESSQSSAASGYVLPVTPAAPSVSNFGDGTSLNVAIGSDTNAATAQYAIRINGGAFTNQFVQAGGTVAAGQVWQTKATWSTIRVTGLATGTTYTFDVVARNTNPTPDVSTYGATAAKAPTIALSSSITNCGGCHGYPGTSNPFVDAAGRNANPAQGRFSGSHAQHVVSYPITCSVCHVAPATETTADNKHSNGTILMANPLNGTAGAQYRKGTSWAYTNTPTAYTNCVGTYCHSNGTSVATNKIYTSVRSPNWGTKSTACNICHAVGGSANGLPNYANLKRVPTAQSGATWTTPANALVEDGAFATYAGTAQGTLILTNFGYLTSEVSDSDTVSGISVIVKGWAASGTTPGNQLNVQLTQNGSAGVGTAKTISLPGTTSAANDFVFTATTPADLWGTTWTPAQVRATTFGVILKDNDTANSGLNIDVVKVIIHTNKSPKMNSHANHSSYTCDKCHSAVVNASGTIIDTSLHNNKAYNIDAAKGYTYNAAGSSCSTSGCHGTAIWGVSDLDCIACHSVAITRTVGNAAGTQLDPVKTEFGLAWGHRNSARATANGAVKASDCIVCHLEGNYSTQGPSAYHQNGNIDLRDPWGAGETPITNMSGGAFTFARFSTSYAAGSRSSALNNTNIAQVISLQFCARCHSKQGATNPTARSNNGGTGTATMPFGGINLGANYTVNNGASVAGGVVNVFSAFSTGNSSVHPLRGPRVKDYPTAARLNDPYKPTGTRGTAGTKTASMILNCFDCHNVTSTTPGGGLTTRTVAAHGNAVTIRGTIESTTMNFCYVCHAGYTVSNNHGTGSAMAMSTNRSGEGFNSGCYSCHGTSGDTDAAVAPTTVRPLRGTNYHGSNALASGSVWPTGGGRPYAFIRNTVTYAGTGYHRPQRGMGELTTGTATCNGGSGCAGNGAAETYSPGGQY